MNLTKLLAETSLQVERDTMGQFEPLLASRQEVIPDNLRFPMYISPKIDGIRCVILKDPTKKGVMVSSRRLKNIPNRYVCRYLAKICQVGLDGELIVRNGTFNQTQSEIMSEDLEPDFEYLVFDKIDFSNPEEAFCARYNKMMNAVREIMESNKDFKMRVKPVLQTEVKNWGEVKALSEHYVNTGFEGAMLRSIHGPYKYGRSTLNEQILLKITEYKRDEATIIGFKQFMHNTNEQTKDEFGRAKRSSHKVNMVPLNKLGALMVKFGDVEFEIGTGFTEDERLDIWKLRDNLLNKTINFKHKPAGAKDKPRFPVFMGFRHQDDM